MFWRSELAEYKLLIFHGWSIKIYFGKLVYFYGLDGVLFHRTADSYMHCLLVLYLDFSSALSVPGWNTNILSTFNKRVQNRLPHYNQRTLINMIHKSTSSLLYMLMDLSNYFFSFMSVCLRSFIINHIINKDMKM